MAYLLKGIDPATGNQVLVSSDTLGGGGSPYDIYLQGVGIPQQGIAFISAVAPRPLTLPVNLVGSHGVVAVAPTADTFIGITQNGTGIGNLNFTAGNKVGVFVFASAVTLAAGDVVAFTNFNAADATLANLSVTLVADL